MWGAALGGFYSILRPPMEAMQRPAVQDTCNSTRPHTPAKSQEVRSSTIAAQ
jgi:hypothetical protein